MKQLFFTTALALSFALATVALAADNVATHHTYMEKTLSQLPPQDAAQIRGAMSQAHDQNKALYEQARKAQEELRGLLTASTFDKDAYLAKSAQAQKLHDQMRTNMDNAFVGAVAGLSLDDRKILAEGMGKHKGRHKDQAGASATPAPAAPAPDDSAQ